MSKTTKKSLKTKDILDEIEKEKNERTITDYCSYYFELRDRKKIVERFTMKKLYKYNNKFYTNCKNKSEKNNNMCKKHIGIDGIEFSTLIFVENLSEIETVKDIKDLNNHQFNIEVNSASKAKAEKILLALQKRKELPKVVEKIPEIPRLVTTEIIRKTKDEISQEITVDKNSNNSEDEYESNSTEESDSDCSVESVSSIGGTNYYINRKLEIIEQDDDGYGFIAGRLEITKSKKFNIMYKEQKYIIKK